MFFTPVQKQIYTSRSTARATKKYYTIFFITIRLDFLYFDVTYYYVQLSVLNVSIDVYSLCTT